MYKGVDNEVITPSSKLLPVEKHVLDRQHVAVAAVDLMPCVDVMLM